MKTIPTLTIMCGVPGLGKDWQIAHNHYFDDIRDNVVSRDELRFNIIKKDEEYFSHEKEVYKKFVEYLANGLAEGKDMVANATHLNWSSRSKLICALDRYDIEYQISYFVVLGSVETALQQNNLRKGLAKVPEEVIRSMAKSFTIPSFEEDKRVKSILLQYVRREN